MATPTPATDITGVEQVAEMFVTLADHEAAFKDLDFLTLTGQRGVVRLHAPRRRDARGLQSRVDKEGDSWPIVAACRPEFRCDPNPAMPIVMSIEKWLDSLTPFSADLVESVALCLAFGWEFQKKMIATAVEAATASMKPASNSTSAAPDSPAQK